MLERRVAAGLNRNEHGLTGQSDLQTREPEHNKSGSLRLCNQLTVADVRVL